VIWAAIILGAVILLVAFPRPTLSTLGCLAVLAVIGVIGIGGVIFYDNWKTKKTEDYKLKVVDITVAYDPGRCDARRPLIVTIRNKSKETIAYSSCKFAAKEPGRSSNELSWSNDHFKSDQYIYPASEVSFCCPVPANLPKSSDPSRLVWSIEERWVRFADKSEKTR
jgi:hypothetical protein